MITEIVTYETNPEITIEEAIEIFQELEAQFHAKQPGFINSELALGKTPNTWVIIQHWDTVEHMTTASKAMFTDPVTEIYRQSLNPKTVKLTTYEQVSTYAV